MSEDFHPVSSRTASRPVMTARAKSSGVVNVLATCSAPDRESCSTMSVNVPPMSNASRIMRLKAFRLNGGQV